MVWPHHKSNEWLNQILINLNVEFSYPNSGVCVAHMFFNRMKCVDVEAICSCFGTLLHINSMILYKMFSMLLPYAVTLLILQICMKHFNDFSTIDVPSVDHQTCHETMWRNIFFIDQFYPLEQRVSKRWWNSRPVFIVLSSNDDVF